MTPVAATKTSMMFDKTKRPPPKGYWKRLKGARQMNGHLVGWTTLPWFPLKVASFAAAEKFIKDWNKVDSRYEYSLPTQCERCYNECNETYPSVGLEMGTLGKHVCHTCHMEGLMNVKSSKPMGKSKMPPWKFGETVKELTKDVKPPAVVPYLVRKPGDIWKLPTANSPFQSEQWGYQGSAKTPYVITRYFNKKDGATTPDGWACSCMNFTRNVPRTPCKHILNIMLKEGSGGVKPASAKLANVDEKKLRAFEKWEAEQKAKEAGNKQTAGVKLNLFGVTARKFR